MVKLLIENGYPVNIESGILSEDNEFIKTRTVITDKDGNQLAILDNVFKTTQERKIFLQGIVEGYKIGKA